MKSRAIVIDATGGPEVLSMREVEVPALAPGEARVRHTVAGINFIDIYHRTGLYKVPLPAVLGVEAAGVVVEVASDVTLVAAGDRVAYAGPMGAYADVRNVAADKLLKVPADIDDRTAAASLLKGMTARYLLLAACTVGTGQTVVVHAAAGGTGKLIVAWALALGARVVAITSTAKKADSVRESVPWATPDTLRVVVSRDADFVNETLEWTDAKGADVVFDSVGRDTFTRSLDCLRVRGLMVSFGQSSGPVLAVDIGLFAKKSLFFTRPTLFHYVATRAELEAAAADLFAVLASGKVKVEIGRTFRLEDAAEAHRALESRDTTGSSLLLIGES
jgi:NADPH2:quinone reductase